MKKQFANASAVRNILQDSKIGLWSIEIDEDVAPRMYVDGTFCEMMSVDETMSPEELYSFWYERINESYKQSVNETMEEIMQGKYAEVQYPWNHPTQGNIYVRCGGRLDDQYTSGIRLFGSHQDVSDVVQVKRSVENLVQALGSDYTSVFYYDIARDAFSPFLLEDWAIENMQIREGRWYPYGDAMQSYIEQYVEEGFREELRPLADVNHVIEQLEKSTSHSLVSYYQGIYLDGLHYFCWKFNAVYEKGKMVGFVVGFALNDEAMAKEMARKKEELAQQKKDLERLGMIQVLSGNLNNVYTVDINTEEIVVYRNKADNLLSDRLLQYIKNGGTYGEAIKIYIEDFVFQEDKEKMFRATSMENIKKELSDKDSFTTYYRLVRNNSIQFFSLKIVKLGEGSNYSGVVLGFADVDAETRREQEKNNELRRQFEIVRALGDIYRVVGYIDLENDSYSVVFRKVNIPTNGSAHEVIRQAFRGRADYEYEDRLDEFIDLDTLAERMKEKQLLNFEFYARNQKWYRASFVVAARNDDGRVIHVLFLAQDINEEKQKEVGQMQALADALIAAEHASQAKTTFLSNMSHDIRTPMNAIIGFTTLANTHVDQPELVKDYLGKIMTSSNHLLSLINDVLDMSRIESGTVKLDEKECNFPDILHDIIGMVQEEIRSRNLEFFVDVVEVVDECVVCDKLRVDRILLNCLNNAVKFTEPGGTVGIRLIQKPGAPEGYADFDFLVCDTGIGMSPEFTQHIFEPFTREQTSTVSGIPGTGLGMAITKNIVELMGGTISVVSEVGIGSEFTISLRFKQGKDAGQKGVIRELEGKKALVVENYYNASMNVARLLEKLGMRPEIANSGKDAVSKAGEAQAGGHGYSVCVIDSRLSDMSGVEAVRQIHSVGGEKITMIVTSYDIPSSEKEAQKAGVSAFCSKPVFLSELRSILSGGKKEKDKAVEELPDFTGRRLLLVEDNPLNREIALQILRKYGFELEVAENGLVAVEKMKNVQAGYYDAVLMDIQMPVMDGYKATRAIRSLEDSRLAKIPIIAMTANAFEEDKRAALEAGMNAHIAKPLKIKTLLAVLNEILQND